MNRIRVGFIGAGRFARTHFATLARMPDVEMRAVADLSQSALDEVAASYPVQERFTDYRRMLRETEIDAAYVVLQPQAMFPIAMDVMKAGKHIFAEKPLGIDIAQTRALAEMAQRQGVKSAVGCNRRHCAVLRKAKALVEERGPISAVLAEFHKDCPETLFNMSTLHSDAMHVLDAMRFLVGEVRTVHAHADRWYRAKGWEGLNNMFHALVRFENGATGVFLANRQNGARREYFEIHGRDISAYVYTPHYAEIYRAGTREPEMIRGEELVGSADSLMTYGYFHEDRDFIEAIQTGGTPQTNFADNLKTMELCDLVNGGDHVDKTADHR